MCGVVEGGIVPGQWGYEAGQSGVGDIFAWFVEHAVPPSYHEEARSLGVSVHEHLGALGEAQPVGAHGLVALDWWSGNRSVLVDHELSGVLVGMTLATRAARDLPGARRGDRVRRAHDRRRVRRGGRAGARVHRGGRSAASNAPLMRCYADVLGRPISVIDSDQGPALGAAMHAAVAAGAHADIYAAAAAMGRMRRDVYVPDPARASAYDELYDALHRAARPLRPRAARPDAPPAVDARAGGRS